MATNAATGGRRRTSALSQGRRHSTAERRRRAPRRGPASRATSSATYPVIEAQALFQACWSMQSERPPQPQVLTGVFQKRIDFAYDTGAFRWYPAQDPFLILSMYGHAFGLTGVSPKTSACFACTCGVAAYAIHL